MKINYETIKSKGACSDGREWFKSSYGESDVDYQSVLDALCDEDKRNWAEWLLNAIGREDTLLKVEGDLKKKSVVFAGRIEVSGSIKIKVLLRSGRGIEAGWGIEAGEGI